MKQLPKVLYHVSPEINRLNILKMGLLPELAQSYKRKAVYACEGHALMWAIIHVSTRHEVLPYELDVYTIIGPSLDWRCQQGPLWYSVAKEMPSYVEMASKFVDKYARHLGAL